MALTDIESGRALFRLRIAGLAVLIMGILIAVLLGFLVSAVETVAVTGPFKGYTTQNLTTHGVKLLSNQRAVFNWLVAILAFAPFLVSSAVLFSGAEVCLAIARRTRTRIATLVEEE